MTSAGMLECDWCAVRFIISNFDSRDNPSTEEYNQIHIICEENYSHINKLNIKWFSVDVYGFKTIYYEFMTE